MVIEKIIKPSFTVIGKQGSTEDGENFIALLWEQANAHFSEIAHLAKMGEGGRPAGIWGAMSDFSLSFRPWEENFSRGLYLAGAECRDEAEPPAGWVKWTLPGYEYFRVENEGSETFMQMISYLKDHQISLAGAVHDFTDPASGKGYMLFPVRKI